MDFIDYDVVERHLVEFNKKINYRIEKELFNEKTNAKYILTTLCLDYSPDNTSSSNQRKEKMDNNKNGPKVVPITKQKKDNDYTDGGKKNQQTDSSLQTPNNEESSEIALAIIDILINSAIEEKNLKEIALKSAELSDLPHLIRVYLLNTSSFYEIESEQGDTIKDLKATIIKMIDKEKKIKLTSRLPDDYDVFYYKEDSANENNNNSTTNEINRTSHVEKTIDDRLLVRMLKSKVLSIEIRKDHESNMSNNIEENEDNINIDIKVYYIDIEGVNGNEELTINNHRTMNDVLDLIMTKKNFICKNKDLYYFQIHSLKEMQKRNQIHRYDDTIVNGEIALNQIKEHEFDFRFMLFPDVSSIN